MDKQTIRENIISEVNATYIKKNHDYGDSFTESYEEFGPIAAIVRMDDKMRRLKTLVKGGKAQVTDESFRDTLLDLINYSIMLATEMDTEKEGCPHLRKSSRDIPAWVDASICEIIKSWGGTVTDIVDPMIAGEPGRYIVKYKDVSLRDVMIELDYRQDEWVVIAKWLGVAKNTAPIIEEES